MFSSPLRRAQQTAQLAGFESVQTLDDMAEWDYGRAEGRTRQQLSHDWGHDWDLWRDGSQALPESFEGTWNETLPSGEVVEVTSGYGETLDDVASRARRVVDHISPIVESGDNVLLVAHAHISRIFTSQWLQLDPQFARKLRLDTAHYSVLSYYKGDRVIERWNL